MIESLITTFLTFAIIFLPIIILLIVFFIVIKDYRDRKKLIKEIRKTGRTVKLEE